MTNTSRRWTGQSQEARRAERRALLVTSAVRLYGSLGFHNTGVRAICRDAGLTERYFYESFAHGEALLLAAFERVVTVLSEKIRLADAPEKTDDERVRRLLHAYYGALQLNPTAARVFLVEIVGVDPAIDQAFDASMIELSQPIIDIYDPDHRGPLSTDPLIRRGVAGGLLHIALAWGADGYERPLEDVVDAALYLCRLAIPDEGRRADSPTISAS